MKEKKNSLMENRGKCHELHETDINVGDDIFDRHFVFLSSLFSPNFRILALKF